MTDSVGKPRSAFRVRPYTLTGGRTRPPVELTLDTVVRTNGDCPHGGYHGDRRRIVTLCQDAMPLAEIAGRLHQPVQVVSILVGDLIRDRAIDRVVAATPDDRVDLALLDRVLEGLQSL